MKDPLKFGWRPKELLPQLAYIYLHLERADSKGAFSAAIAASDRYRQDMFPETCQVTTPMPMPMPMPMPIPIRKVKDCCCMAQCICQAAYGQTGFHSKARCELAMIGHPAKVLDACIVLHHWQFNVSDASHETSLAVCVCLYAMLRPVQPHPLPGSQDPLTACSTLTQMP